MRICGLVAAVLGVCALLLPSPYVVDAPGPTFNTIGKYQSQPLIQVSGHASYPTSGPLDLTTVQVAGGPGSPISMIQAFAAWANPNQSVTPVDLVYPHGVTGDEIAQENAAEMTNSQEEAVAGALHQLKIPYTEELAVADLAAGSVSQGRLAKDDVILSADGVKITGIGILRSQLQKSAGRPVDLTVRRSGKETHVAVGPKKGSDGTYQLGIYLTSKFQFPFDVKIALNNVGGPSAGMMFALGIIDTLTSGDLTGGKHFAGTGTIDSSGTVGPIGGIRQKMIGAHDSGADIFLAPAGNCGEVTGHIPDGLTVYKVATLDDALKAVRTVASGGPTAALATCS